ECHGWCARRLVFQRAYATTLARSSTSSAITIRRLPPALLFHDYPSTKGMDIFSTVSCFGRLRSAVIPQQYIVPEAATPPYSSQTAGQDEQPGSKSVKSSKPCDMNPVT